MAPRTRLTGTQACPCASSGTHLGDLARAELALRAQRVHLLDRLREHELGLALDVLGTGESLPAECRTWVEDVVDAASRDAAQASLDALLQALAARLAGAPSDVLAGFGRSGLRCAVELA